jgi:hypothetical protein
MELRRVAVIGIETAIGLPYGGRYDSRKEDATREPIPPELMVAQRWQQDRFQAIKPFCGRRETVDEPYSANGKLSRICRFALREAD